jgi:hypothetical protein
MTPEEQAALEWYGNLIMLFGVPAESRVQRAILWG